MGRKVKGIYDIAAHMLLVSVFAGLLFLLLPVISMAQAEEDVNEIPISLKVRGIGKVEIQGLVVNRQAYLSITELFDFLKIKSVASFEGDSISGFFINPSSPYIVDKPGNKIIVRNNSFNIDHNALILRNRALYLRVDYLGTVFGLNCSFDYSALVIQLNSSVELPSVREKRLEGIRRNLLKLKGDVKADTNVRPSFRLFHFGIADWSLTAVQDNMGFSDIRPHLSLGASIMGGEATSLLNYNKITGLREQDQYYQWRHVDNDHKALRQVLLGKIRVPAISSIYGPILGVQVSNAPTTFRRSFGSYTISNFTKPGWTVELYVNNTLVEYKIADASGYYSFDVPLVYGASEIMLRFYGLNGEEGKSMENINIPFNFLPKKTFEYTASAGIAQNSNQGQFSKLSMSYGVSQKFTVGTGYEYLSSASATHFMPVVNVSALLFKDLMFTADYMHDARLRGILSYLFPNNARLELNYIKYKQGQTVINNNYLEERKLLLTTPVRFAGAALFSRIQIRQVVLPLKSYMNGEWVLSGSIFGINTHIGTYLSYYDDVHPNTYTDISFGLRLPGRFVITPQIQYDYGTSCVSSIMCQVEKKIRHRCYLNLSYNRNNLIVSSNYAFGLRYDFGAAQFESAASYGANRYTISESIAGSLLYDRPSHLPKAMSGMNQGKGGVVVTPFLDINGNGVFDEGEHKVTGLRFRMSSGHVVRNAKDTVFYIYNLEPYQQYFVEPDINSFDNISWRLKKQIIGVNVSANQMTPVNIPVAVVGEVSGSVILEGNKYAGLGRVIVYIYNAAGTLVTRMLSDEDGHFDYIGLAPGSYHVRLDDVQLQKLKYRSATKEMPFEIRRSEDGDIVSNLIFNLTPDSNK